MKSLSWRILGILVIEVKLGEERGYRGKNRWKNKLLRVNVSRGREESESEK